MTNKRRNPPATGSALNPSVAQTDGTNAGLCRLRWFAVLGLSLLAVSVATAAETPYPFEGTWIRAERVCSATTVRARTYTAKDVVSPRGRCAIRRVAGGASVFELLEDCRLNDRPMTVTETIRMTSPDSMTMRRQLVRLKIPRPIRYTRCSIAAPATAAPARPPKPVAPATVAEPKKP